MGVGWAGSSGGTDWRLELTTDRLLPGRLATGRVELTALKDVNARALVATLRGQERWRYTVSDGKHTSIVTGHEDEPPIAVVVAQPVQMARGETRSFELSIPVPSLGPATLDGLEAAMSWSLELKLDLPKASDKGIVAPVCVLQPTALLRAGVVHVGQFALYEAADAQGGGVAGSIELDPVPLVAGSPFLGRLILQPSEVLDLTEIRVEVRVRIESTVSGARHEVLIPFAAVVAGSMRLASELEIEIQGVLDDRALPTIELRHGRCSTQVHVILARRFARDPHLVRDVAIATTSEV
jgi:hypothetical protein